MSFLKKLFGGGDEGDSGATKVLGEESYQGFTVRALEMKAGSEFQLCGEIEKEVAGEIKVHKFIRADRLSSPDQAETATLAKGRQIVDEQGEAVFS